jgi:hypothetical protein
MMCDDRYGTKNGGDGRRRPPLFSTKRAVRYFAKASIGGGQSFYQQYHIHHRLAALTLKRLFVIAV